MSVERIKIFEYLLFNNIEIEVSNKINIIIGENGTGKTHILKLIYDESENRSPQSNLYYSIEGNIDNCVYIPAKDMLTHSKGFISMSKKYKEFPFEKSLIDIVQKAEQWQLKEIPTIAKNILPILERMMNGTVEYYNDEFYIKKHNGDLIKFSDEAEGYKRIGLLWQLLMNESITQGTVLLWDEPEANLNPKFTPEVVDILLELSRNGVQVIICSHDYILTKYFDIKCCKTDKIRYHSFYRENNTIKCESANDFGDIKNNAIETAFEELLDSVYSQVAGE